MNKIIQNKEIGMKIKEKRKEKSLTLQEVADKLGVSKQTVSLWENGKTSIKRDKIENLAKLLNIDMQFLLGVKESDDKYFVDISMLNSEQQMELNQRINLNKTMFFDGGKNLTEEELEYIQYLLKKNFISVLLEKGEI